MTGQRGSITTGLITSSSVAMAADALRAFGQLRGRVAGASMLPALQPGDLLEFRPCLDHRAEAGEVVLFCRDERLVVHRVLARTADGVLTQGDGVAMPDSPVADAEVLGRMVSVDRHGRVLSPTRPSRLRLQLTRSLFGRFHLATRLFLRWQRLSIRTTA